MQVICERCGREKDNRGPLCARCYSARLELLRASTVYREYLFRWQGTILELSRCARGYMGKSYRADTGYRDRIVSTGGGGR